MTVRIIGLGKARRPLAVGLARDGCQAMGIAAASGWGPDAVVSLGVSKEYLMWCETPL